MDKVRYFTHFFVANAPAEIVCSLGKAIIDPKSARFITNEGKTYYGIIGFEPDKEKNVSEEKLIEFLLKLGSIKSGDSVATVPSKAILLPAPEKAKASPVPTTSEADSESTAKAEPTFDPAEHIFTQKQLESFEKKELLEIIKAKGGRTSLNAAPGTMIAKILDIQS